MIRRPGVAVEAELQVGLAALVGRRLAERIAVALPGALRVEEAVARVAPEGRERRRERQHRFDATLLRRRAEEVLHPDARGEPGRAHPALGGVAGQRGGDLHAIGQELLHVHGGRSDLLVGLAVLHDRERDGVGAGGRALDGLVR